MPEGSQIEDNNVNYVKVMLTRDSICMADDVKAPHENIIEADLKETIKELMRKIKRVYGLAGVAGGNATWVAVAENQNLAVFAQKWKEPRLLVEPGLNLESFCARTADLEVHFRFKSNDDPEGVFEEMSRHNKEDAVDL